VTPEGTIVFVMAHKDAQATFDRHVPFWNAHKRDVRVFCPVRCEVNTYHRLTSWGSKCHHGPVANARFRIMLTTMWGSPTTSNHFLFYEYDSLCLDPGFSPFDSETPGKPFIAGNIFSNNDPRFKGSLFVHPPLAFNRQGLQAILSRCGAGKLSDAAELGFWDRWLGLACNLAGVAPHDWGKSGFSRNTIEPPHVEEAVLAVARGAVMVHGVKDAGVLNQLITARMPATCC
jgi:hypothetical protein